MSYTPKEFKRHTDSLWRQFKDTQDRARRLSDILYAKKQYSDLLPKSILNRVDMPSVLARHEKENTRAAMRRIYRRHYEPLGGHKREDTAADRLEVWGGWAWNKLNKDNRILDDMYRACSVDLFGAYWLDKVEFVEPEQMPNEKDGDYEDRRKRAREQHFPWVLDVKGQLNVAFTENNKDITSGLCKYKLPIVDIMERFYEGHRENKEQMYKLLKSHAGFLPIDEPRSEEAGAAWDKEVDVLIYATHDRLYYYCDLKGKGMEGLGETEWQHMYKRPPLVVVEGVYNGPQEDLAFRREPVLLPFLNAEDKKALLATHMTGLAFTPKWPGYKLPAGLSDLIADPPQVRFQYDTNGLQVPVSTMGGSDPIGDDITDAELKLLELTTSEAQIVSPLYQDGQPRSNDTATQDIMQRDQFEGRLASAQISITNAMSTVEDMMLNDFKYGLNERERYAGKSDKDWSMSFYTTGSEYVVGRDVKAKEQIIITPQDADIDFERVIEPVDTRTSTQMQNITLARMIHEDNADLEEDWIRAHGHENVTEFIEKKNGENMFHAAVAKWGVVLDNDIAQYLAMRDTRNPDELLMQVSATLAPPSMSPPVGTTDAPYVQVNPPPSDSMGDPMSGAQI